MNPRSIAVVAVAALAAGCASPPIVTQPPMALAPGHAAVIATRLPDKTEKYLSFTSVDNSYFGVVNEVRNIGAAVAVGLLLGPVGVAANMAHNNSINKELIAQVPELTATNLADVMSAQLPELKAGAAAAGYEIVPAATVQFKTETTYWLICNISVTQAQGGGATPWKGRYVAHADGAFDAKRADDTPRAVETLGKCLRETYELFQDHAAGKVTAFETKTVALRGFDGGTSERSGPVAVAYLPARVVMRDYTGGLMRFQQGTTVK